MRASVGCWNVNRVTVLLCGFMVWGRDGHFPITHLTQLRMLCVVFVPSEKVQLSQEEFEKSGLQGFADYVVLTDVKLPRSFASVHPV